MQDNSKQIDTILKTFALLNLLLKNNASFSEVLKTISNEEQPFDNSTNSVTLTKYLNTLKLFGLNIKKEKGKYQLINSPYKIELPLNELKTFNTMKECAKTFPTFENAEFQNFIDAFELHYSPKTKLLSETITHSYIQNLQIYDKNIFDKIKYCTKLCNEDYKVELIYFEKNIETATKTIAKPRTLIYRNGIIKLEYFDLKKNSLEAIALDKIISIKQNPEKSMSLFAHNKVVVFGLKDRLAKNYNIRPWETSNGKRGEWLIIVNKDEPEEELLDRLIKYGDKCVVYTPHSFKDKLHKKIKNTLALYENN